MTQQQLTYIVEHSKSAEHIDAALTILEHDFSIARPTEG